MMKKHRANGALAALASSSRNRLRPESHGSFAPTLSLAMLRSIRRCWREAFGNTLVRLKRVADGVRCEVADEGPGLSSEDQKKLFGKFARLSVKPTGGEHATGLGLSIVKRMVEAMNGEDWCESELGHGATFLVQLH
jgi:signal transduction histidine kinase